MLKHIPNLLSLVRLAAAPLLFYLLLRRDWVWALWLIALAALTDALDGWLARRLGANSRPGEVLDPIADKALLSGAFLALTWTGAIELWLGGLVIGRDVLILAFAGRALLRASSRRFPPSRWGKASTVFQALFVVVLIATLAGAMFAPIVAVLKWGTAGLTALSGIDYAYSFRKAASRSTREPHLAER
ncbi:MAG TPA: CDP-alcohol phosphatidyltransferase family protein [Bryobacteraceae bacterium]|nr:CDP-alcohol phosphatidyltransferase family protein [Bryobacteraceae bacterium]